jgi:two-component system phosphate regulon response regulator OmpR
VLAHLLIVDDDDKIRKLLKLLLEKQGFAVSAAINTEEADKLLAYFDFDLMILDVMMPKETGVQFLARKSGQLNCPVIMLSAMGEVDDRISGLESGADDYIGKPFDPKELILRINKLIKRKTADKTVIYVFGEYSFDMTSGELLREKLSIELTSSEQKILKVLLESVGKVVRREEIAKKLSDITERAVDTQIARLRSKLQDGNLVKTIRGEGYLIHAKLR